MTDVGTAALQIIPSFQGFQGKLEQGSSGALVAAGRTGGGRFGDAAGKEGARRFGLSFGRLATGLVGGYAALKIKDVLLDSIDVASDISESTNKVRQIFGDAGDDILKFSTTADQALGQSIVQARDAASQFGIFGKAAGLSGEDLSSFAIEMDTLAGDLASFNNTSPEQAIEAIGAALRGESEPIRQYGVLLDDATLRNRALKLGLIDTTKQALTPQQKVLAAHAEILRQTSDAQGDFARTSGGLANQQRILSARWENAKGKLGKGLLPVMTDAVSFLNREGIPAFENFADWFTKKGIPAIGDFADDLKPLGESLLPAVGTALGTVRDALQTAAPYAKDLVDAFNDMPDWAKKGTVLAGLGLYGGKKLGLGSLLGGGRGSAGGGLLGGISKAAPLPVFVVNELPGGGAGGIPGALGAGAPEGGGKGGKLGWIRGAGSTLAAIAPVLPAAGAIGNDSHGTAVTQSQWDKLEADAKAKDLEALAQAGRDVDRVFASTSPTVDGFAMSMSGLGGNVEHITPRMADARAASEKFGGSLRDLPKAVVTKISSPGAIESRQDAIALVKQYDLTPKQKHTLFEVLGIPTAKTNVAGLIAQLANAAQPRHGSVSVETAAAEAALNRVLNLMNAVNRRGNVPAGPGVLPGESGRTISRGGSGRRPAQINIHLDGQRVASVIDERIATHDDLAEERRRAGVR